MASQDWTDRIIATLHAFGKRHRGGLSQAEKAAKVFPSYVRQRKGAGTIDLRKMLAILEALGEHPSRFFRRVFPERRHGYRAFIDTPSSPPPEIIACAYRRLASNMDGTIARSHLEALDALRFEKPQTTLNGTAAALDFVDPNDVSFALGVWASAQRQLAYFDDAAHALIAGLVIAEESRDFSTQGNLLQRLSYLVADHWAYEQALTVATLATDCHARVGDLHAIGRSMVDRGAWLYYLEQYADAITLQGQALSLLAADDALFQVTARQGIGLSLMAMGKPDDALKWVTEAWSFAHRLGANIESKLRWLEASIDAERGNLEASESKLKEVVQSFANLHYGEAAVATIELADVQLRAGKPASAYESAHAILPFVTPLGIRNPLVKSAEIVLVDLAHRGVSGISSEVTVKLRRLLDKLRKEHHTWRRSLSKKD